MYNPSKPNTPRCIIYEKEGGIIKCIASTKDGYLTGNAGCGPKFTEGFNWDDMTHIVSQGNLLFICSGGKMHSLSNGGTPEPLGIDVDTVNITSISKNMYAFGKSNGETKIYKQDF